VYQSQLHLPEDADATKYRAVSGLAIFGLLVGLASLFALGVPLLWGLAIVALVVNVKALKRIKVNAPALLGRKAALAGLAVSVVALCGAPASWIAYRWMVRQEARQFAGMWFDFLRADQPHKAHQLALAPTSRDPLDDTLWDSYREEGSGWPILRQFVAAPDVRTLLALGSKATVRYYATESQWSEGDRDRVYQTFAVTYPDSDGLKTFFVGLVLDRTVHSPTGHAYWQVGRNFGGVRPKALGGSGEPPKS
jgi:hypothetical protein